MLDIWPTRTRIAVAATSSRSAAPGATRSIRLASASWSAQSGDCMAKVPRNLNQLQTDLAKLLRQLADRQGLWQVFQDFVAASAIAISNAVDWPQRDEREADYMRIISRYTPDQAKRLAEGLALVVEGLETGHQDFLGALFMALELGDSWKGQFFTPYELGYLKARMMMGDHLKREVEEKGFITIYDPASGAGALLIAAAHAMLDVGVNYQHSMHATAIDISITAVHMTYIQLALLHVPAVVRHGNSLSGEIYSEWKTPAHVIGLWDRRLARAAREAAAAGPVNDQAQAAGAAVPVASVPILQLEQLATAPVPAAPSGPTLPAVAATREQLALF